MAEPAHPRNVAGDFYVADECCAMCGVPSAVAPDLFAVAEDGDDPHCFVSKQPETPAELDRMLEAIRRAELRCVRYRGRDLATQVRITDLGEGAVCDALLPELVRRNAELAKAKRRRASLARWTRKLAQLAGRWR